MDTQPITKEQVAQRLGEARERIHALGARRIALFGSVVRGEARLDSDVDLLVQFDPAKKTFRNFMELCFLLDELMGRRVELLTTESLSPFIGPHILREAEDIWLTE